VRVRAEGRAGLVRPATGSRRGRVDLLRTRPDCGPGDLPAISSDAVRRVDQVRALVLLVERGVLSAEEFERQEEKVYRGSRSL
jgi:hypothetical protein